MKLYVVKKSFKKTNQCTAKLFPYLDLEKVRLFTDTGKTKLKLFTNDDANKYLEKKQFL